MSKRKRDQILIQKTNLLTTQIDTDPFLPITSHISRIATQTWPKKHHITSKTSSEYPRSDSFGFRDANDNEKQIISHPLIYGQQNTAKFKPNLIVAGKDAIPNVVIKGPFNHRMSTLILVYERVQDHHHMGDQWFIPVEIIQYQEQFYFSSPNIAPLPPFVEWGIINKWKLLSGWKVSRNGEYSARSIDQLNFHGQLPYDQWVGIYYHLLIRYILRGADAGLWNILQGLGADYEEIRNTNIHEKPKDLFDLMFSGRTPRKKWMPDITKPLHSAKPTLLARLNQFKVMSFCKRYKSEALRCSWIYEFLN